PATQDEGTPKVPLGEICIRGYPMRIDDQRRFFLRLPGVVPVLAALFLAAGPASFAQETDDEGESAQAPSDVEEVVVTGSRLKRDTYTSVAPLQIISGQVSREIGPIDPAEIL